MKWYLSCNLKLEEKLARSSDKEWGKEDSGHGILAG